MIQYADRPQFVKDELGKLRTYIDRLEEEIVARLTGRRAKPPQRTSVVDELLDLDAVSLKVYLLLLSAQNATGASVLAPRKELARLLQRSPRTISNSLQRLRQRELIYRIGMSRYAVRTTPRGEPSSLPRQ
ncbi:MAG: hypothetical protein ACLPSH_03720 [Vulcanimicrobiaceae bacterium]